MKGILGWPVGVVHFLERHFLSYLVVLLVLGVSFPALAKDNDIHLHFLYEGKSGEAVAKQQLNFRLLSTEYGFAITDPVISPAETLGIAGLDMGIEFTLSDIPETSNHWRRAIEDYRPDNQLFITRLRFRKGLPFSFELDGNIGFIYDSTSIIGGLGLKWALNEGFEYFPDFAIRAGVTRVFSSRDMDMMTVNVDFFMSKQFSIVGMMTITPYVGYSLVFVRSGSNVLDPTPNNFKDNETPETGNFVFATENIFGHRIFFGARFVWYIMSVTFEGAFTLPDDAGYKPNETHPKTISMFNTKISFFF